MNSYSRRDLSADLLLNERQKPSSVSWWRNSNLQFLGCPFHLQFLKTSSTLGLTWKFKLIKVISFTWRTLMENSLSECWYSKDSVITLCLERLDKCTFRLHNYKKFSLLSNVTKVGGEVYHWSVCTLGHPLKISVWYITFLFLGLRFPIEPMGFMQNLNWNFRYLIQQQ